MKSMFLGFAAAIVIAVIAGVVLTGMNTGADKQFASENVRL